MLSTRLSPVIVERLTDKHFYISLIILVTQKNKNCINDQTDERGSAVLCGYIVHEVVDHQLLILEIFVRVTKY